MCKDGYAPESAHHRKLEICRVRPVHQAHLQELEILRVQSDLTGSSEVTAQPLVTNAPVKMTL
jgi:hypothetical protein